MDLKLVPRYSNTPGFQIDTLLYFYFYPNNDAVQMLDLENISVLRVLLKGRMPDYNYYNCLFQCADNVRVKESKIFKMLCEDSAEIY